MKEIVFRPMPKKFQLVLKSDPELGDSITSLSLNLAESLVTFSAKETHDFKWMEWLTKLPEEESVTLFFLDENGKHRCVLLLDGPYIQKHACDMGNNDSPTSHLTHEITLSFANISRQPQQKQAITSSENLQIKKSNCKINR